jgi:hypothetical protein
MKGEVSLHTGDLLRELRRQFKYIHFVLENTAKMNDATKAKLTDKFDIEPITINSADFSASRRSRYYW